MSYLTMLLEFQELYKEFTEEKSALNAKYSDSRIALTARESCRDEVAREVAKRCASDKGYQELEERKAALQQERIELDNELQQSSQGESIGVLETKLADLDKQVEDAPAKMERLAAESERLKARAEKLKSEANRLEYESEHMRLQDFADDAKGPGFSKGTIVAIVLCVLLALPGLGELANSLPYLGGAGQIVFAAIMYLFPAIICGLVALWKVNKDRQQKRAWKAQHAEVIEDRFEQAKRANAEAQAANATAIKTCAQSMAANENAIQNAQSREELQVERDRCAANLDVARASLDRLGVVDKEVVGIEEELQALRESFEKEAQASIEAPEIASLQAQRDEMLSHAQSLEEKLKGFDLLPRSDWHRVGRVVDLFQRKRASTIGGALRLMDEEDERNRMKRESAEQLAQVRREYERQLEEQEQAHQRNIDNLERRHEEELDNLDRRHEEELDDVYRQHEEEMDDVNQYYQDREYEREQMYRDRRDRENRFLQRELEEAQDEINRLRYGA